MKTLLAILLFATPAFGQVVEFLNYDSTTKLPQYRYYTVKYRVNPNYGGQAWHLWFNQQAGTSRYTIPMHDCDIPPYNGGNNPCKGEFTFFVNASLGAKLRFWVSSYLPGVQDVSGYATVVSPTTGAAPNEDTMQLLSRVFPNPAENTVEISFSPLVRALSVVSAAGDEVYRYVPLSREHRRVMFDVRGLPSGSYLIHAITEQTSETASLLIIH